MELRRAPGPPDLGPPSPGDAYADYGLVFATEIGTAFLVADVSHKFKRALARAGLRSDIRFHDLRHASATAMLAAGIHPKGGIRPTRAEYDRDHDGPLHTCDARAGRRRGREARRGLRTFGQHPVEPGRPRRRASRTPCLTVACCRLGHLSGQ
ncbi:MAG TPA: tyrosine-type recombinase/integrase [Chloroflexota bacterium]|nr:tyrosine-type recombinase/integrase [Chloroflexota bacterium]